MLVCVKGGGAYLKRSYSADPFVYCSGIFGYWLRFVRSDSSFRAPEKVRLVFFVRVGMLQRKHISEYY